jgi:hypothetical protein
LALGLKKLIHISKVATMAVNPTAIPQYTHDIKHFLV